MVPSNGRDMNDVYEPYVERKIIDWRAVRESKDALKALEHAVRDAIARGHGVEAIRAELEMYAKGANGWPDHSVREDTIEKAQRRVVRDKATKYQPPIDYCEDERRRINLTRISITDAVDQTIDELARLSRVYQRHGLLCDFVREAVPTNDDAVEQALKGLPRIRAIPPARLIEYVSQAVQFVHTRTTNKGDVEVKIHPPKWAGDMVAARGEWEKIRPLRGVYAHPVLMPDGRILQTPGYDAPSGVYYAGSLSIDVPELPTKDEARAAVAELLEVISDFPLTDVGRAVFLAGVLTLLARPAIDGPTPLSAVEANSPGAGKGLLLDVIGEIVLGQRMNASDLPADNEEVRKFLFSIGLSGCESLLFDNIKTKLGGSALEMALTSGSIQARKLGGNEQAVVPWTTVTFATMNNGQWTSDMSRRAILARLDTPFERPERRTGFRHDPLLPYVRANRQRLLTAAMTVLSAYQVAGRPRVSMRSMGSFESWSAVVRAPIVWCGLPDPAVSQDVLLENGDPERDDLDALLTAWYQTFGERRVTGAAVLDHHALREVATDYADIRPADSAKRKLGAALSKAKGRIVNGLRLDSEPRTKRKSSAGTIWFVHQVGSGQPPTEVSHDDPA